MLIIGSIFYILYLDKKEQIYFTAYNISFGIYYVMVDLSFFLLWIGIYESSKVLLLLNKRVINSELLD
jgi:hypothetical protein